MSADFAQVILKMLDSRMMSDRKKFEDTIKVHTDKTRYDRTFSENELDAHLRALGQDILRLHQQLSGRNNIAFAKEIARMVNTTTEKWSEEIDRLTEEVNDLTVKLVEKDLLIKELQGKKGKK